MRRKLNATDRNILHMVAVANAQQTSPSIRELSVAVGKGFSTIRWSLKRLKYLHYITTSDVKGAARTVYLHPSRIAYLTQQGEPTQQYYQVL